MKKNTKAVSLGIALTEHYVEAALLESCGKELTVRRGGRQDLPAGVIQGGRIREPKQLGAAVRQLLRREGIRQKQATVCLPDGGVLTQILEIPRNLPANLHQHIRSEIRHSPLLSGRGPVYDFIRLGEGDAETSRLFVGAADRERLEELFQAFHPIGLEAAAVEVSTAAVLRAIENGFLKKHFDRNMLIADWTGGMLSVCVLVKEQVDFIRRSALGSNAAEQDLLRELGAIRQFYEIEKELFFDASWLCVFVSDRPESSLPEWKASLEQTLGMEVCAPGGSELFAALGLKSRAKTGAIGAGAIGLAMRPFEKGKHLAGLDFVPEAVRQFYRFKRLAKQTLAACAAVVLAMFLLSSASGLRIERLSSAKAAGAARPDAPIAAFAESKHVLQRALAVYHQEAKCLEKVLQAAPGWKWSDLLQEVQRRAVGDLWISSLEVQQDGLVTLRGQAASHAGVYQFVDLLKQSKLIGEPQLSEIRQSKEPSLFVEYVLTCRLQVQPIGGGEE